MKTLRIHRRALWLQVASYASLAVLSACFNAGDLASSSGSKSDLSAKLGNFQGCVEGVGVDTSSIQLSFEFPAKAEKMTIYRDGIAVFASTSKAVKSFIDSNLLEGKTYHYSCEAAIGGKAMVGAKELDLTPLSFNPPTFTGIKSVTKISPTSVLVKWNPTSGVMAKTFKVYTKLGSSFVMADWDATPSSSAPTGVMQATINGLGDELPYTFGVKACSAVDICSSGDGVADTITVTLDDGGAPQTPGATAASTALSTVQLTAPWQASQGGVKKRRVYRNTTGGTNIATYTLIQTLVVPDITAPATTLSGGLVAENTTYYYIVRDEDPTGNVNTNTSVVTVNTGDLTAPTFAGMNSLNYGTPADTVLTMNFTAITSQPGDPNGASHYMLYQLVGSAGDSCASGDLVSQIDATAFTATTTYNYDITGLQPRTQYSFCLKARDLAGNISSTTTYYARTTRDLTPPDFDGVQSMSYNNGLQRMEVGWNPSTSSDILEYQVQVWKNTTTPTALQITNFVKSHAANSTGFTFTTTDFPFVDNDTVYVVVNACDNAAPTYGMQNCSAYPIAGALSVTVPDITPPAGFLGVSGPGSFSAPSQGTVNVAWNAPGSWVDYRGFRVYTVDPGTSALTFLKDCPCSGANCPDTITSCQVTGLDAFRTYLFHVRAYDAMGNVTTYLNPATNRTSFRTSDTTIPTFTSNLTLSSSGAFVLNWNAATDNQYASEPGATITYLIYRLQGAGSFSAPTNPVTVAAEGVLLASSTLLTYTDSAVVQGQTYNYTICAQDASLNKRCDGNVKTRTAGDVTNPVITGLANNKTSPMMKSWNLSWSHSDNVGVTTVYVYKKEAATLTTATTSDDLVGVCTTLTPGICDVGLMGVSNLTGAANQDYYISYLVRVMDAAGNYADATTSLHSTNKITVTSLTRNAGDSAGGKLITFRGTGYGGTMTVTVGGAACTGIRVWSESKIGCFTPAGAVGAQTVVVTQTESGSSEIFAGAYTYVALNSGGHICDNPGSWASVPAGYAAGTGAPGNPLQICNGTHLHNIRNNWNNFAYRLMDNVDLSGYNANMGAPDFTPIPNLRMLPAGGGYFLDGNFMTIYGYKYTSAVTDNVALFQNLAVDVYNLDMEDFNIQGRDNVAMVHLTGGGCCGAAAPSFTNVNVSGTVQGRGYVGGFFYSGSGTYNNVSVRGTVTATSDYSGLLGADGSFASTISGVTAYGTVNGNASAGGILGRWGNGGRVLDNAKFYGTVSVTTDNTSSNQQVGGLIGWSDGVSISNSLFEGTLNYTHTGNWHTHVGGMIGWVRDVGSHISITNSYFKGNITNNSDTSGCGSYGCQAAGLIGYAAIANGYNLTIQNCHYEGNITSTITGAGLLGLVSMGNGTFSVDKSYAIGTITSTRVGSGSESGGLFGSISTGGVASVTKSFSNMDVLGLYASSSRLAGLAGGVRPGAGTTITFQDIYVTGQVRGNQIMGALFSWLEGTGSVVVSRVYATSYLNASTSTDVTALIGRNWVSGVNITYPNSFWAYDATDSTFGVGLATNSAPVGGGSVQAGKLNKTDILLQGSYVAGWDFTPTTGTWVMPDPSAAYKYPVLRGVTPGY